MKALFLGICALAITSGCGDGEDEQTETASLMSGAPSVLVDLDPDSTGMSITVESITASSRGQLFTSDRESGDVLRIDPASPAPVVVGTLEDRTDAAGMPQKANGAGLVFTPAGDLLIASGAFNDILRLRADELASATPAAAQTFITGVNGANSVLLEGDELFVSGGATGNVYRAPASGGAAEVWTQIEPSSRSVPPDNYMQAVVSNGLAREPSGALLVADTARAAVWRIPVNADGSAGTPEIIVEGPQLEGVDGLTYDPRGRLWGAVNERNALVVIDGDSVTDAYKNDNAGPLEFPAALVFVRNEGYVVNFDRARADNFADDGVTSSAGIGASIARFAL
jgi:sugar lactone lactonase YvrE